MLLSMPEGKPKVAPIKPFNWDEVLEDAKKKLASVDDTAARLAEWREFVDARPKTDAEAAQCSTLPKWDFACRPAHRGPTGAQDIARARALASAIVVEQPQTIRSSVGDGAEGAAAAKARRMADEGSEAVLAELQPGSFAMVSAQYDDDAADAGGCRIPRLLVQLPDAFPDGLDTRRRDAKLSVRWWEPKPPNGKYTKEWRKWMDGRRQYVSEITRDMITLVNVGFTRQAPLSGGFRKFGADTKRRLEADAGAKYLLFS